MKNIAAKMVKALAAIDAVEKKGRNQKFGYNYVKATDVANEVRNALHEAGVAFTYQVLTERFWETPTSSGGMQYCCALHVQGTFTDGDSGESLSSSAIGWGADTQDKAPYKAMTGALKYLLRTTFLIPDELDPELEQKEAEVRKEVDRQREAAKGMTLVDAVTQSPPELEWGYNKSSGVLICRILDAKQMQKKDSKADFVCLQINGKIEGSKKDKVYYWHATHRDLLLNSIGQIAKFAVAEKGDFPNVTEVLEVDGVRQEKPVDTSTELKARTAGSILGLTDKELLTVLKMAGGDWQVTLDRINEQIEKQKEEANAVS